MDPAAVAIVAALIGAGSSIVATVLTMRWSGRHDEQRQLREESSALRTEKRAAYADLIRTLLVWREATVELADGDRGKRDWDAYWTAREKCMKAAATLEIVGTKELIDAASEAMELLLDVSWRFQTHTALAHPGGPPSPDQIVGRIWGNIGAADIEQDALLDLMRIDLGFAPLGRSARTPPPSRTEPVATDRPGT